MKTHTTKEKEEVKEQAASIADMTEALRNNCEQALRNGLKFQEEARRWWSSVLNPATCVQHWQEQLNAVTRSANSVLPLAQKPFGEVIDLVERNSRSSAELVKKAIEAAQSPALSESQAKWSEFWTSSMEAVQSNTEALSQINSRMMDTWAGFVRKGADGKGL